MIIKVGDHHNFSKYFIYSFITCSIIWIGINLLKLEEEEEEEEEFVVTLLNKTGTLCYANSALQAILPFKDAFPSSLNFLKNFLSLMENPSAGKGIILDPLPIIMKLQSRTPLLQSMIQHDSSEFLEAILEFLNDDSSFIGEIITKIYCPSCLSSICKRQPFKMLHLLGLSNSLQALFKEFVAEEELLSYRCEGCCLQEKSNLKNKLLSSMTTTTTTTIKQSVFSKLPQNLFIQLPRTTTFAQKNTFSINFDDFIAINSATYTLQSVICHSGTTHSGHYVCYRRNANKRNLWSLISDSNYKGALKFEDIKRTLKNEAYILLFSKTTTTAT